jgi:hypothetical protein
VPEAVLERLMDVDRGTGELGAGAVLPVQAAANKTISAIGASIR